MVFSFCRKTETYNFPKGVFPFEDYRAGRISLHELGFPSEKYVISKPPVEIKVKAIGDDQTESGVFMRQELPNHFDELIASIGEEDEDELTIIQFDEEVEEGTKVVVTLNFIDGKEDEAKQNSELDVYHIDEMEISSESPFDSSQKHLSFTIRPVKESAEPIAIRLSELPNDPRDFNFLKTEIIEESSDEKILLRTHFELTPEYLVDSVVQFFDFKKLLVPLEQVMIEDVDCFEKSGVEIDENGIVLVDYFFFQEKEICEKTEMLILNLAQKEFEIFLPKNSYAPKLLGFNFTALEIVFANDYISPALNNLAYLLVEDKDGLSSGIGLPKLMPISKSSVLGSSLIFTPIKTPHENILLYELRLSYPEDLFSIKDLQSHLEMIGIKYLKISDQPIYDSLRKSSIYPFSLRKCEKTTHKFIISEDFKDCTDAKLAVKILKAQLDPCDTEVFLDSASKTITISSKDPLDRKVIDKTKEILGCLVRSPRTDLETDISSAGSAMKTEYLPYAIPGIALVFILWILAKDLLQKQKEKDSLERIFFLLESLFIFLDICSTAAVLSIYLQKRVISDLSTTFIILIIVLMLASLALLIFRNLKPMDHFGWIILDSLSIKGLQIFLIGLYFVPFIPATFGYPIFLIIFAVFGLLGFLWNMVMWFSKLTEERERTKEMIFFGISGVLGLTSWICFLVYILMNFGRTNLQSQFRCIEIKEDNKIPTPFSCFEIGQFFFIIPAAGAVLFGLLNLFLSLKSISDPGQRRLLESREEAPSNRDNQTLRK
ncbi:Oidioi.mRNA.OKI2018_I69.PAR.g9614.t1.cds [Oikopleura dioica]|uniref:Oidioi.mRNA.OKI2018_I69.PAR.g9614.t1.cds n=1 Tax=Oikopleura dioica TaxID=34765 RepID=A0ABN7RLD4_OIKDI|nr:Oidioi.mRNA.OKI2018_I69.PAR.g9614.t1.cds [Oikopleura dioica]